VSHEFEEWSVGKEHVFYLALKRYWTN